jgi:hypothetical protein
MMSHVRKAERGEAREKQIGASLRPQVQTQSHASIDTSDEGLVRLQLEVDFF